jgi:hypothetical protein
VLVQGPAYSAEVRPPGAGVGPVGVDSFRQASTTTWATVKVANSSSLRPTLTNNQLPLTASCRRRFGSPPACLPAPAAQYTRPAQRVEPTVKDLHATRPAGTAADESRLGALVQPLLPGGSP